MLVYVILVAAVNLSLGYGAALCLGRGPGRDPSRDMSESHETASSLRGRRRGDSSIDSRDQESQQPDATLKQAARQTENQPKRKQGGVEASIVEFMDGLENFRMQVTDLDKRVRECGEDVDVEEIKERVEDLRSANSEYLESTSLTAARLDDQKDEMGDLSDIGETLRQVIEAQTKKVEATEKNLGNLNLEVNASGNQQKILEEAGQLTRGNNELSASLSGAHLQVARKEGWLAKMEPEMMDDDRTSLASRAGVEFALEEMWRKDPHRAREVSFAMVDLDHCGQLNEEHGTEIGDKVIQAVAQIIESSTRQEEVAGRYQGATFLVMFPDNDPRHSTSAVERMRQVVEETRFQVEGEPIKVTISCAVAQVEQDDTVDTLFERLAHAIQEAKRYGRNRTFLHEGKYPAPVVPPNLSIEGQAFDL